MPAGQPRVISQPGPVPHPPSRRRRSGPTARPVRITGPILRHRRLPGHTRHSAAAACRDRGDLGVLPHREVSTITESRLARRRAGPGREAARLPRFRPAPAGRPRRPGCLGSALRLQAGLDRPDRARQRGQDVAAQRGDAHPGRVRRDVDRRGPDIRGTADRGRYCPQALRRLLMLARRAGPPGPRARIPGRPRQVRRSVT
jgi:hypothetical protein